MSAKTTTQAQDQIDTRRRKIKTKRRRTASEAAYLRRAAKFINFLQKKNVHLSHLKKTHFYEFFEKVVGQSYSTQRDYYYALRAAFREKIIPFVPPVPAIIKAYKQGQGRSIEQQPVGAD